MPAAALRDHRQRADAGEVALAARPLEGAGSVNFGDAEHEDGDGPVEDRPPERRLRTRMNYNE